MRSALRPASDLAVIFGCYLMAVLLRVGGRLEFADPGGAIGLAAAAAITQVLGNTLCGAYRQNWPRRGSSLLMLLGPAAAVGLLVAGYDTLANPHPIPYGSIPVAATLSTVATIALRIGPKWLSILSILNHGQPATVMPLGLRALPQLDSLIMSATDSIREAIRVIDGDVSRIALVADSNRQLIGVVTDGDVRRAILAGVPLSASVTEAMTTTPIIATTGSDDATILGMMREHLVRQIPIVDELGRVTDIRLLDLLHERPRELCSVLIMAGGLGLRLGDLTRHLPKPLMRVGGRPILEMLIRDLASQGFGRIYLAVNYKADLIESHFGDGREFGASIHYIREHEPMGTAGAIRLVTNQLEGKFIVTNADLLTRVNFRELLSFHERQGHELTIAVIESTFQLRYGLVETKGSRVTAIREKPEVRHFVNAGIYVLEKEIANLVPAEGRFDMDALIESALRSHRTVGCFPVHEYWTDIGDPEDLRRAHEEVRTQMTRPGR